MKRFKTLRLALIFSVTALVLWYGVIAVKANSRLPVLQDVSGDPAALEGFTINGTLVDRHHNLDFTLKDGVMHGKTDFAPLPDYYNIEDCYGYIEQWPSGSMTPPEVSETFEDTDTIWWKSTAESTHLYGTAVWRANPASNRSGNEQYRTICFDTGIEIPQSIRFSCSTKSDGSSAFRWHAEELPDGEAPLMETYLQRIGDTIYAAVNLPLGGANVYRIDTPLEDWSTESELYKQEQKRQKDRTIEQLPLAPENLAEATRVCEYTPDQVQKVFQILPFGEKILVLALVPEQTSDKVGIHALVYNDQFQPETSIPLMELPSNQPYDVIVYQMDQPVDEPSPLRLILSISDSDNGLWWYDAAVVLKGTDEITAQVLLYPTSSPEGLETDLPLCAQQLRSLLTVQTDAATQKTAVLSYPIPQLGQPADDHLYLDIWQDGQKLYTGTLDSDWGEDSRSKLEAVQPYWGGQYKRSYSFPISPNSRSYSGGLYAGYPGMDLNGNFNNSIF